MSSKEAQLIERVFHHVVDKSVRAKNPIKKRVSLPRLLFVACNIQTINVGKHLVYVIRPKHRLSNKTIMYIHGGGFVEEINIIHWRYIHYLLHKTQATVYVPIYPLATSYYSSAKDVMTCLIEVYKYMLKSISHEHIHVIGDSAGGTLVLTLGQQLKFHRLSAPKNLICLSPLVDLQAIKHATPDPVLPSALLDLTLKWYVAQGDKPKDSFYSPLYGNSKNIGFIAIFIGTRECFLDSARIYHKKLNAQKIKHIFYEQKDAFHIYPLFKIKESRETNKIIIDLINNK